MLTAEDKAVLAHLVVDPDGWISRVMAQFGPDTVLAKCRRAEHVAAYRAASAEPGYEPRGPLPSAEVCALVDNALAARAVAIEEAALAKAAQQDRIKRLFD